ncbi:MAG: DUF167 domain-containing protein [Syntrophorhabdaceae bacterium]|nr:DUF167 domain-containing protein [Syntrophorhabdaceae bacterium]MDD4196521.1 DUF167 domain-containing protein [Syntrophorhabdaceae bacterium]HOC45424.1 DUF167 domain-containing protein [Syntrophorhabdaceae bacterium]
MKIEIKVIPNARKRMLSRDGSLVTVRLTAQPLEGKANEELVRYLSEVLKVKRSAIKIVRGEKDRRKIVDIPIDEEEFDALLCEIVSRRS